MWGPERKRTVQNGSKCVAEQGDCSIHSVLLNIFSFALKMNLNGEIFLFFTSSNVAAAESNCCHFSHSISVFSSKASTKILSEIELLGIRKIIVKFFDFKDTFEWPQWKAKKKRWRVKRT